MADPPRSRAVCYGRCRQQLFCVLADGNTLIRIPPGEPRVCPECRQPLKLAGRLSSGTPGRAALQGALALCLALASAGTLYAMHPASAPPPGQPIAPPAPRPAPKPAPSPPRTAPRIAMEIAANSAIADSLILRLSEAFLSAGGKGEASAAPSGADLIVTHGPESIRITPHPGASPGLACMLVPTDGKAPAGSDAIIIGWVHPHVFVRPDMPITAPIARWQLAGLLSGRIPSWGALGSPDQPVHPMLEDGLALMPRGRSHPVLGRYSLGDSTLPQMARPSLVQAALRDPGALIVSTVPDAPLAGLKQVPLDDAASNALIEKASCSGLSTGRAADFLAWLQTAEARNLAQAAGFGPPPAPPPKPKPIPKPVQTAKATQASKPPPSPPKPAPAPPPAPSVAVQAPQSAPPPKRVVVNLPPNLHIRYGQLETADWKHFSDRLPFFDPATTKKPGTLQVNCLIGTDGAASACRPVSGAATSLDSGIMAWLSTGAVHYTPTMKDGHPIAARRVVTVKYGNAPGD